MPNFNLGQRVRVITEYFSATVGMTGIVRITAKERHSASIGIDFEEHHPGFHNLLKKLETDTGYFVPESHCELVKNYSLKETTMPNETTQEVINLNISRGAAGKMELNFSIPAKIEGILKSMPNEIKESSKWPGLQFYFVPELVQNKEYKELLHSYDLFDNYGSDLIDPETNRMNIAWMRTVGGQGSLPLNQKVGRQEATTLVRNCTAFIRDYYNNFHRPIKVIGKVEIEL